MTNMKKLISIIATLAVAAFALTGCGYSSYIKSVDSANKSRVEIVKQEQVAKVAEAVADEAGFDALKAATQSADPVVSAIASAQLGTVLAVRAVTKQLGASSKSAAATVQLAEKPTDPIEVGLRALSTVGSIYLGVRQSDNATKVQLANIEGETTRSISSDGAMARIAESGSGAVRDVVTGLAPALERPTSVVNVTNESGNVNVGGDQRVTNNNQRVRCSTGDAGSSGPAGNGAPGVPGATPTATPAAGVPGGSSGPGGAAGSNNCGVGSR